MATIDDYSFDYKLRPLQQQWVLDHALAAATRERAADAVRILTQAVAVANAALDVELTYEQEVGKQPDGGDTRKADRDVIRALRTLHEVLAMYADGDRSEETTRQAAAVVKAAFPKGYAHHATTTYDERLGLTAHVLKVMAAPEHAQLLTELALTPVIAVLANKQAAFRRLAEPEMSVTIEDRDAARAMSLEHFKFAVSALIGMFDPADPAKAAARDAILFPLTTMKRQLSKRHKANKRGAGANDVSPVEAVPDEADLAEDLAAVMASPGAAPCEVQAPAMADTDDVVGVEDAAAGNTQTDAPVVATNAPTEAQPDALAAK